MSKEVVIQPTFVSRPHGQLFVAEFIPSQSLDQRHTVVVIPPFAEEMNRCRRMMAEQARSLAKHGFRVVIFDLYGTGDSEGDFSDARWNLWCEDVRSIVSWGIEGKSDSYSILAIRFGSLLALDPRTNVASGAEKVILWNPIVSGKNYLRQILRLRLASQLVSSGSAGKELVKDLMGRFESRESVEVGGYEIAPCLADEIGLADLTAGTSIAVPPIFWFEIVPNDGDSISVSSENTIQRFASADVVVKVRPIAADAFWNTVEVSTAPQLISATTSVLTGS